MISAKSVVIADLGVGNLRSVARAVERAGGQATITADPDALVRADRVIVPGQGAFRDCVVALERGFGEALRTVIARGNPYLGLCLGMQLLFEESEEAPGRPGIAHFKGRVRRFSSDMRDATSGERLKVPHMGWNTVRGNHALLPQQDAWFYFVHSFYCQPEDPDVVVGTAEYGGPFCVAVGRDNVFACQFHPEKSQEEGHRLLQRFVGGA
ncbi:MAG: imidazole glycerol phosphate synthase subunit HisH [Myxococcales bacterium]